MSHFGLLLFPDFRHQTGRTPAGEAYLKLSKIKLRIESDTN